MSQEIPTTILCAKYQFYLIEIIDSLRQVYGKKHESLGQK
jgi:hypothetical protein